MLLAGAFPGLFPCGSSVRIEKDTSLHVEDSRGLPRGASIIKRGVSMAKAVGIDFRNHIFSGRALELRPS